MENAKKATSIPSVRFDKHGRPSDQRFAEFIRRKYGITVADYERMRVEQNYCCAICGLHERDNVRVFTKTLQIQRLEINHCHASGRIRGLLCGSCNRMLGYARDDQIRMVRAVRYLQVGGGHRKGAAARRDAMTPPLPPVPNVEARTRWERLYVITELIGRLDERDKSALSDWLEQRREASRAS